MASAPLISIVIPAYNRARDLRQALASLEAQTLRDFEIIIVDDASQDDTHALAQAWPWPQKQILRHSHNRGAAAARNSAMAVARGRYIAFLDSDDLWHPTKLARQTEWLAAAPASFQACCSGFRMILPNGALDERRFAPDFNAKRDLLDGCFLAPGSTLMITRTAAEAIGPQRTDMDCFEDWDWLLRYLRSYQLGVVGDCLADIRWSPSRGFEATQAAAKQLAQVHCTALKQGQEPAAARRLKASLEIETLIAAGSKGLWGAALNAALRATASSPVRMAKFLRRAMDLRRVGRRFAGRRP